MLKTNEIYLGDCLEVMKEIDDGSVDLVMTSPPYYNAKEYSQYDSLVDYMNVMKNIFSEVERIVKQGHMVVVNISPIILPRQSRKDQSKRVPLPFYFVPMMESIGYDFLEDIIWEKPSGAAKNRNGGFFRSRKPMAYKPNIVTEYILVFRKKATFLIDKSLQSRNLVGDDYEKTNIWRINPEKTKKHPAPFPLELPDKVIRYYSYEESIVLDPFIGSGTTAIACMNTNRNFIGIEKDESYYNIAKERVRNHKKELNNKKEEI